MTQRLFFGLPIATTTAAALRDAVAVLALPPGWRWTPESNWHLTLLFLGAATDAQLPALVALGERCVAAAAAPTAPRGELCRLGGLPAPGAGALDGRSRLLAALADVSEPFLPLHAALAQGARELGFAIETRPLLPHVTLARRGRTAPAWCVERLPSLRIAVPIDTLVLYRSEAAGGGPRYVPVWSARLRT